MPAPHELLRHAARSVLGRERAGALKYSLQSYRALSRWMSLRDARCVRHHLSGSRGARTETIRIRRLDVTLPLRPGTADALDVMDSLVGRYHLPPSGLEPRIIVDAGLCTGLTLLDLARRYPAARVVGIEPQPYYASLARALAEPLGDRIEVLESALWPEDGIEVELRLTPGLELGASVVAASGVASAAGSEAVLATTVSLNAIVARLGTIDYLKLDVEGAERDVLRRETQWASRTSCVNVELHNGYTVDECTADLARLGFTCAPHARHPAGVVGLRDG